MRETAMQTISDAEAYAGPSNATYACTLSGRENRRKVLIPKASAENFAMNA